MEFLSKYMGFRSQCVQNLRLFPKKEGTQVEIHAPTCRDKKREANIGNMTQKTQGKSMMALPENGLWNFLQNEEASAEQTHDLLHFRHVTEGAGQPGALDVTPEELRKLQDSDESLDRLRLIADGAPSVAAGEQFFRQDGLVYRRYTPAGSNEDAHSVDQLVLPTQLRQSY